MRASVGGDSGLRICGTTRRTRARFRGSGDLGERPTQQPTTAQAGGDDDDHAGARRHAGGTRLWMYVPMLLNIVEMSWPRIVAPSATTRAIKPTSRAYSAIVAPFVSRASRRMISI